MVIPVQWKYLADYQYYSSLICYSYLQLAQLDCSCMVNQLSFITCCGQTYSQEILIEGTTQLCRTSKLSISAKDEDNYLHEQARRVWDFILGKLTV